MNNEYIDRKYIIFGISEINKVKFDEILETSAETIIKSIDGSKTFIKWDTDLEPAFISDLTTKEGPYSYDEIISILYTDEWNDRQTI